VSITGWLQGLEDRVERLETWAGPGQIEALAEGQRAIRADIAKLQATADRHEKLLVRLTHDVSGLKTDVAGLKTDVAVLKADVAELKQDMGEVKATLAEILRRLPDHPGPN
jgi:septal ring factor EnvC (AmiA/AmiB activator)